MSPGWRFHLAVVTLLAGLLLFSNLHEGGLSGYDDALYAHEGEQMLRTGDWWNVRCNGSFNFEYPPMFFWLEALSMSLWGATDFAAKFPSALAGLLTIVSVFLIGRAAGRNDLYPVCAAWILMLTQYFLKYSMHAMTDVPYALFFTLAILFYLLGLRRPLFFLLCGCAVAAAILTRSVLGCIPLAVILGHGALAERFRPLRSPAFAAGMALAIVLPALWYVPQYRAHGAPFLEQSLQVITSKVSHGGDSGARGFLWDLARYPGLLAKLYWPWLPLLILGLWTEARRAWRSRDGFSILLLLWIGCILVPLSLADSKTLRYIMPAFGAFALAAAVPSSGWLLPVRHRLHARVGYVLLCLAVAAMASVSSPLERAGGIRAIGAAVQRHVPAPERVHFYTGGAPRHDDRNQMLWYSKRRLDHHLDPAALVRELEGGGYFVVDRPSWEAIVLPRAACVTELAGTEAWVLFARGRQAIDRHR